MPPALSSLAAAHRAVRFAWFKSGLFWRTFFLMSVLTAVSMGAWIGMINWSSPWSPSPRPR
jgi:two-component system osmolarity sensor histidine kinase EnvZ